MNRDTKLIAALAALAIGLAHGAEIDLSGERNLTGTVGVGASVAHMRDTCR